MLGLPDKALLLARRVPMHIPGHPKMLPVSTSQAATATAQLHPTPIARNPDCCASWPARPVSLPGDEFDATCPLEYADAQTLGRALIAAAGLVGSPVASGRTS
jgi:hypothetical protein